MKSSVGRWTAAASMVTWLIISSFILISQATQVAPPLILFNSKAVSEIELPSPDPPSLMVCESETGNPPPQLHWEVDGKRYLGRTELVNIGPTLYMSLLIWDRGGGWHVFDNANEVACRAEYPGLTNVTEARVSFNRDRCISDAPRTVKVLVEGFIDRDVAIRSGESVHLACISDGHPAPSTFTWEWWSEEDQNWRLHNSLNEQNVSVTIEQLGTYRCKASNGLNQHSPTTSINQLTVSELDGPMVVNASDVNVIECDMGLAGMIAIALGVTQFITLFVFTLFVILLRRNLKRSRNALPPSSRPSMARSKAIVITSDGNAYVSDPVSRRPTAPPTSVDMGSYDSVRRTDIDSSYYLEPIPVYEQIRDRSTKLKGEGDIEL